MDVDLAGHINLLMHVCCGPCATWPLLKGPGGGAASVTGLFYNPNIHPIDEFNRRRGGAAALFKIAGRPLIVCDDYMEREWAGIGWAGLGRVGVSPPHEENQAPARADGYTQRCAACYRMRLEYTAAYARDNGYDAFTTSLLISPYQNHGLIIEVCEGLSWRYGVGFYYHDYRPHFREGQKMAREAGLYRQKYCGCIFSSTYMHS